MVYGIQKKAKLIGEYGCYFLSLLKASYEDDVFGKYDYYVQQGWMDSECFIKCPVEILKDLTHKDYILEKRSNLDARRLGFKKNGKDPDILIGYFYNPNTSIHHFVLMEDENKVKWDPYGTSKTVQEGFIESYRVFWRK